MRALHRFTPVFVYFLATLAILLAFAAFAKAENQWQYNYAQETATIRVGQTMFVYWDDVETGCQTGTLAIRELVNDRNQEQPIPDLRLEYQSFPSGKTASWSGLVYSVEDQIMTLAFDVDIALYDAMKADYYAILKMKFPDGKTLSLRLPLRGAKVAMTHTLQSCARRVQRDAPGWHESIETPTTYDDYVRS